MGGSGSRCDSDPIFFFSFFLPPPFDRWISAEKKGTAASYKSGEDDRRDSKNHLPGRLLHVPHLFLHPLQRHFVDRHRGGKRGSNRSSSRRVSLSHVTATLFRYNFELINGGGESGASKLEKWLQKCSCLRSKKKKKKKVRI